MNQINALLNDTKNKTHHFYLGTIMNYKIEEEIINGTAHRILIDNIDDIDSNENNIEKEDITFSLDSFQSLETPIEKLRYFCLYNEIDLETFHFIIDELISYLYDIFETEISVAIKALNSMTYYNFFLTFDDFTNLFISYP